MMFEVAQLIMLSMFVFLGVAIATRDYLIVVCGPLRSIALQSALLWRVSFSLCPGTARLTCVSRSIVSAVHPVCMLRRGRCQTWAL